jgi:predicted RNA binding protein YcfA (HicA-like mRNA interferase family)
MTGRKVYRVVRRRGSHIFYTIGSQMAVNLSNIRTVRPLHPRKISGTHLYKRLSRLQDNVAAGRVRSIEKSSDLIGTRSPTFRLVA